MDDDNFLGAYICCPRSGKWAKRRWFRIQWVDDWSDATGFPSEFHAEQFMRERRQYIDFDVYRQTYAIARTVEVRMQRQVLKV